MRAMYDEVCYNPFEKYLMNTQTPQQHNVRISKKKKHNERERNRESDVIDVMCSS